jgi:formylglycine-generating enzyme required for sulfatase activity
VHEVSLDGFRIARYPVTVGQYKQFVDDDGYMDRRWWEAGGFGQFPAPDDWEQQVEYPSRPVVSVSWWEAMAYCAWARCRLPTEAEWERAARGTEARRYPWGIDEPDAARTNYGGNMGHPTPVGIYPLDVTPDSVLDMGGNVWEWCLDGGAEYKAQSVINPTGGPGRLLVVRCQVLPRGAPQQVRAAVPGRVPGLSPRRVPLSQSSQAPAAEPGA